MRGVILVLLAALCWGTTGTAQSFAPAATSAYWVGALRLLAASAFFAVMLMATRGGARARLAGLPWTGVLLAGASMAAYNLAFFAGVRATGVAVGTAVALGSGPIWAGVLQALAGQWPSARWWLGTALAVAGGVLMVGGGSGAQPLSALGIGLCLLAGLSYAVYALVNGRLVKAAAPAPVTAAVFGVAMLIALPCAAVVAGVPQVGWRGLAVMAWLGVVATGVAYLLFSHALRHIAAATGVTLALAEPVTAFVLAVLVVGERPGWAAVGGGLLVLGGLLVVVLAELRASPAKAAPATA